MKYSKKEVNRGFTLIELLVVIAIVGILSSIVLVSLNQARSKADDARIKQQLSNIRSSAANYYDSNGDSFGTATDCTEGMFADTASGVAALVASSSYSVMTTLVCEANPTAYAVAANLATSSWWCIDSAGAAKEQVDGTFVAGPACQ